MSAKVYTVKSNARRDAKKRGLDPSCVVACPGGFIIQEAPKKRRAPGEDRKRVILREMLVGGWQRMDRLQSALGWQAHTVRGAISTLAKKESLVAERRRVDGVTSYRLMPSTQEALPLAAVSGTTVVHEMPEARQ